MSEALGWHRSVREHAAPLRQWTRRLLGGDEGLDDVMQEVALATVTTKSLPEERDKVLPWLKSVARHKVQDHWRKVERQRRLRREIVAEGEGNVASAADWVLEVDRIGDVRDALDALPDETRRVLLAKYGEGKSYAEIAAGEGTSIKSVEYRLSKARAQLRRQLTRPTEDLPEQNHQQS